MVLCSESDGKFGLVVLHPMAFVDNGILPSNLLKTALVSNHKFIGSKQNVEVTIGDFITVQLLPLLRRALVAHDNSGREPFGKFIHPVG